MATLNIAESIAETRNYPYNCWWVAGFGNEVGRSLLARWLLDTPVVLFRQQDGTVAALEDRCPHRQAPLSLGRLRGDTVECGYHGICFDATGRCVRVPSADAAPSFSARHFPVKEVGPFVWVWLGDASMIGSAPPPPELPWMTDPTFATRSGQMEISANYMLLKENVLDLTHFGYVHASTFQIEDWTNPPEVSGDGETVGYRQRFVNKPLAPGYAMSLGVPPGTPWNREHRGSFLSPALQEGCVDFQDPSQPERAPARFRVAHATTPVDQSHMLYFWVIARDFATVPEAMDHLVGAIRTGFDEDRVVLEAIQAQSSRGPRRVSTGERSVKADAAGIQARRIVARWMEREV
ncbi:vanillate O-demethylase monooxygenase subunit [Paraburkholderia steynii]|uniref:Vanillate O-demethylase monooxygenase subunit n=1 Tax=Paraburkholderia steynii TaxID=1245441 RepID=A0A7Z7BB30_9BURK|nr:aromatic ring-hydroxylating dioxygenase subunit alpha [Paraburkholderia steynii]SDI51242.1 vanillate O-demethylase monooxygenase subunit [Paraburkholderia steynii]